MGSCPSELNIWGEKEYFSTEWSWCCVVMAIIIIVGAVIAGEMFVLKKIEQYRRVWDKYSIRVQTLRGQFRDDYCIKRCVEKMYANKSCGIIWNNKYRCHRNKDLLS